MKRCNSGRDELREITQLKDDRSATINMTASIDDYFLVDIACVIASEVNVSTQTFVFIMATVF
jgi:TATA-binding protein-associated factor Taf7